MASALQVPPVAVLRASSRRETIGDAEIGESAITDTTNDDGDGEIATTQSENYIDNDLSKLMYCLPISESERKVEGLHVSSSGSSPLGERDSGTLNFHTRDAAALDESKEASLLSNSSLIADHDSTSRDVVAPEETKEPSLEHGERCRCGCIPNTPSLFEMAELRRQHRLKLKNSDESKLQE